MTFLGAWEGGSWCPGPRSQLSRLHPREVGQTCLSFPSRFLRSVCPVSQGPLGVTLGM